VDPEVSVVIPTRNRWRLLSKALDCAFSQAGVDVEVLVVDEGSTDETVAELAAIRDPRLRVLRNEQATGVARARNRGIEEARGEWIAFLDDDDLWSPAKLRLQLDTARLHEATLVYCGAVQITEAGKHLETQAIPIPGELHLRLLEMNVMPAGSSNVMVRAELLKQEGGFDTSLFQLADWDLWIRLAAISRPAACADVLVGYVRHATTMLVMREQEVFDEFAYIVAKHRAASEAAGVRFDPANVLRWMAGEYLFSGRRGKAARTYVRGAVAYRDLANVAKAAAVLLGARPPHMRRTAGNQFLPTWLAEAADATPVRQG
jgi:glycosyltransferase involved in cell wall biosynthesis